MGKFILLFFFQTKNMNTWLSPGEHVFSSPEYVGSL